MSTWHFEPWAHTDIREISKDLTHQLPNLSSHILKTSIFLLQEVYINTLPCQCWAAQSLFLPGLGIQQDSQNWAFPVSNRAQASSRIQGGGGMVTTLAKPSGTKTWPSFSLLTCVCSNTTAHGPLQGKPLNSSCSSYCLFKREMQTGNQDTLQHGNCQFKHLLLPINQKLLISGDSLELGALVACQAFCNMELST